VMFPSNSFRVYAARGETKNLPKYSLLVIINKS